MTGRRRLPDRRNSQTTVYERDGHHFRLAVSSYPEGAPGEIFLNVGKTNSTLDVIVSDIAILTSLALQHGCSLSILQHAVKRDSKGRAASLVGEALDQLAMLS